MPQRLDTPPPPKSPQRPADDQMPGYTPGAVPPPEGEAPPTPAEGTAPPDTYPPKQKP
ncbi:hypothetical protein [Azospirillum doebereinerae]|uniref:hypothetical protein n=1 Tax=Azospirillum doebereinerae TaxID=92933 RepID=UPI00163C4246|nr:hypothetical protein [Azospirillum doebereinerae]MCG5243569.1 hypothetical protein [Azospirillum doebereinerae]